jgi:hypothetical protein
MPDRNSADPRKSKREVLFQEEEFIVPTSDAKGHSIRIQFRVPTGFERQAELLMRDKKFPYPTRSDLYRHALLRHYRWLETLRDEGVPSVLRELDLIVEVLRDDFFQRSIRDTLREMEKTMSRHMGEGSANEARRLLSMIQNRIERMPDGYYKTRYRQEVEDKWGHIMKGAKTARLKNKVEEEEE